MQQTLTPIPQRDLLTFILCMLTLQPGFCDLPEDFANSFWGLTPKELTAALPNNSREERGCQVPVCCFSNMCAYAQHGGDFINSVLQYNHHAYMYATSLRLCNFSPNVAKMNVEIGVRGVVKRLYAASGHGFAC